MVTPTSRNRLDEEASPYLRQHADNPVNWQPWDEQALATAREHDVPIFLSIGYAACHWCHVMEEESFEDGRVASLLNEHFVPIKVDREERPDVDSVYMSICQRVTGRGGWPLSAWLTPEGEPFYVGTYFPPDPRRGQPGFRELLEDIADSWADPEERADLEARAAKWARAVRDDLEAVPDQPGGDPDPGLLERAAQDAVRGADREYGGWGGGPKFPHPGRVALLLCAYDRTGREPFREVATETLTAMADGGLFDQLGRGFHRYCTDREWVVPHFEKMLYDNAELPRVFLAGHRLTGDDRYAEVAADTLAFLGRELQHPDGGFFSTLDARSAVPADGRGRPPEESGETSPLGAPGEQAEGAYYVWTPADVEAAIDDDLDADLFADRFGVTAAGNFEGATVLTRAAPVSDLAAAYDLAAADVEARLARATEQARAYRGQRPRPARDEKILAGWNGLAVSAFAAAEGVLEGDYAATGAEALGFVRDRLWDPDAQRLARRFKDGDVAVDGYLEDYAFLGRGAFDLYGATADVDHLAFALDLARGIEAEFWDADAGTLYLTPASGEGLIARPQELTDQSTPSSAGVAARLLAALDHFVPHDRFGAIAEAVVRTHEDTLAANPLQHASLVTATDDVVRGPLELTLVADEIPEAWRETLSAAFLPDAVLAPRPADEETFAAWLEALSLQEAPPIWRERGAEGGEPTVYACRSFTCSPPERDLEAALSWARDRAGRED